MNYTRLFLFAVLSFFVVSCENKQPKDIEVTDNIENVDTTDSRIVSLGNRLFSIPSPIQTAYLIQSSGVSYNKNILNNPSFSSKYSTKVSKSLNLGIYGADLGYVNLYEQTQDAITYLNACKKISDDLGITTAFTPEFQKKFEKNLGNKDSLLSIVSDAYKLIDVYLQNNQNNDLGSLILAGGWIESLYFATTAYKTNSNEELKNRIGEQKYSLINLIKLLEMYANGEDFEDLLGKLRDLNDSFDKVEIEYIYAKPETQKDKKLTILNNKTEVKITKELIDEITLKITSIRNDIVA